MANSSGGYRNRDGKGKRSGRTEPNLFGGYTTYDEKGKKVGRSEPNLFGGGYTHYDASGKKIGSSEPNIFGGFTNYDQKGRKVGSSDPNVFGGYTSYDTHGHKTGSSDPSPFNSTGNSASSGEGCYLATCVYGAYDAPEVRTLRRFRDEILKKHALGRVFIRYYYAISPHLVRRFGKKAWFHHFWRKRLNGLVSWLEFRQKQALEK